MCSDGDELDLVHRRSDIQTNNKSRFLFYSPNTFIHARHHLSSEQLQFLQRGPTYVSPGQVHLIPYDSMIDQVALRQMVPLKQSITKVFSKLHIDVARQMNFSRSIESKFLQSFAEPLPTLVKERALYERNLIESIGNQIVKDQLILQRTADEYNTYYLGPKYDYYDLADTYIQNSKAYDLVTTFDGRNSTISEQQLDEMVNSWNFALEELFQKKMIPNDFMEKYKVTNKSQVQLPYMYFLPKINQV